VGSLIITNDIVCMDSFSKSKAYLKKIAEEKEIQKIACLEPSYNIAAILFSIKEAAYKAMLKKGFNKSFAPKKYVVGNMYMNFLPDGLQLNGYVNYATVLWWFQTDVKQSYCHTLVANDMPALKICKVSISKNKNQTVFNESEIAHQQLLSQLEHIFKHSKPISIIKNQNGVPELYVDTEISDKQVSISHDGLFAATVVSS